MVQNPSQGPIFRKKHYATRESTIPKESIRSPRKSKNIIGGISQ